MCLTVSSVILWHSQCPLEQTNHSALTGLVGTEKYCFAFGTIFGIFFSTSPRVSMQHLIQVLIIWLKELWFLLEGMSQHVLWKFRGNGYLSIWMRCVYVEPVFDIRFSLAKLGVFRTLRSPCSQIISRLLPSSKNKLSCAPKLFSHNKHSSSLFGAMTIPRSGEEIELLGRMQTSACFYEKVWTLVSRTPQKYCATESSALTLLENPESWMLMNLLTFRKLLA